jgi:protein-tyrosine kinase
MMRTRNNTLMSRIHRVVEKAERDGRLTRTQGVEPPTPPNLPGAGAEVSHGTEANPIESAGLRVALAPPDITATPALDPLLIVAAEPASPAAEQYRLLRTHLFAHDRSRRLQLVLVTSPCNGDGKTLTAANLAVAMAQEYQQRVLLLEADLRRPTISSLFDLPASPGLAGVLVGGAAIETALVPVADQHLTLLPAGEPPASPTELVGSAGMRRTIESLRSQFDRIVIDTPPVALADTHVLASFADGILLVVRAGVTPRDAVERALGAFDRNKLLGLVLNEVEGLADDYYAYAYTQSPVLMAAD